ncbi:MAG TPA: hypothetical protein VLS89_10995 [Candidatus Nanopelagicales bacterium]|nr:hypothetical protein [Candidatus Nanopelagicales bacterium]
MNVLIIPEDFRKDQYVLRPIIRALLADLGKPRANVRVLTDPLLGGIDKALDLDVLRDDVLARYRGMVQLFLLLVDRDGKPGRGASLANVEREVRGALGGGRCLLAECAHQEIEVWALAGADDLPKTQGWAQVRAEMHPKEVYFEPYAASRGLSEEPGEGRDTLGREAASRLPRLKQLCPEIAHLASRVGAFVSQATCEGEPFDG